MDFDGRLRAQVAKATGHPALDAPVTRLKQDASNRSYYRVGVPPSSWVLMVMPPDVSRKSEEVQKGAPPSELPFLNVRRYLERIGVRVPRVLRYDEPAGMMVLEDLGDLTFENALRIHSPEALYPRAIDLLAHLRFEAEQHLDPGCIAFNRAFDEDLYEWELHHFREYGLEIWSGRKPTGGERERLNRIFKRISAELAAAPRGFTHRDYQSRNLMVKHDEIVVIDFQDALQGPRQYDLVALLRDSYVELDASLVDRMLDRYLEAFARLGGERIDPGAFKAFFDLLTVQRKLKDAGRFEFINRVKGNPDFLVSIPASLRYVKQALERLPELSDLREIVAEYVPELR
jgi:aminoglycoside/choline kinase family phosphotransferase